MNHPPASLAFLLAFTGILACAVAADDRAAKPALFEAGPDGQVEIFNGKDLTGWDADSDYWKVEDGEIVGKVQGPHPYSYLTTKKAAANFRLILEIKLTPNEENSGIQIRSIRIDGKNEMKGMQADVGKGWWGHLYEEHERGLLTKENGEKWVKPNEWNTYEVVAVGSKVRTAINGHLCVDMDDPKFDLQGIFGFQMHQGNTMEVRFRKLKLELNPQFELKTLEK